MDQQTELDFFQWKKAIKPSNLRKEPTFWIQDLVFFRSLENPSKNIQRHFKLHRGLNILWAKPFNPDNSASEQAVAFSGHAAGKTLFCRLLRFALGEHQPANELVRKRLSVRFPDGWVGATVFIRSEPWFVCRPVTSRHGQFAIQGATLDDFLNNDSLPHLPFSEYSKTLNETIVGSLPIRELPDRPGEIGAQHLLPWFCRDQESRFSGVADWRNPNSGAEPPATDSEERHFLMRVVLGLIEEKEKPELDKNAQLTQHKADLEKKIPLLQFRSKSDLAQLRESLAQEGIEDLPESLDDDLFVDSVQQKLKGKLEAIENLLSSAPSFKRVQELQEKLIAASNETALARRAKEEADSVASKAKTDASEWETQTFSEKLAKHQEKLAPPPGLCLTQIEEAKEKGCPCYTEAPLNFQSEKDRLAVEQDSQKLKEEAQHREKAAKEAEAALKSAVQNELVARSAYSEAASRRNTALEDINKSKANLMGLIATAKRAKHAHDEALKAREDIKFYQKEITDSYERQKLLRKSIQTKVAEFNETFETVCQFILGSRVDAAVRLSGRSFSLSLSCGGVLDSAALETIKVLAFDLAALLSGIQNQSLFPGFLIHDGPREADMDPWLYRRIFYAAKKLEEASDSDEPAFQYILTTTEPPPDDLKSPEWLLDPVLDATHAEQRLLAVNL
ncbi:MAG: hypothetical protein GVY36_17055 [Verrucomicrobia bacterium]|jgi:hypothetical protein|nr:hypothetical protein [Verrucomicrobiota bacterium]